MDALSPKARYSQRFVALKALRDNGWRDHWKDIFEHVNPARARFLVGDWQQAGSKKQQKIINGTATWASRVQASGMMAGITSPARPWFRLTTPDPDLAEAGAVRSWLHTVEERIREALQKSNVYQLFHSIYSCIGDAGTAAGLIEEDEQTILRGYFFPIGSYCLATNDTLRVDTLYRETTLSVGQLVSKFGLEKCSSTVKALYENKKLDERVQVVHLIQPNEKYEPGKIGPVGMRFASCWYEANGLEGDMLRESGYVESPLLTPRWEVTGEDVYGSSPGMDALGDIRALQQLEKRKAMVVDKIVNPPMRGPSALRKERVSLLPGDITYVDSVQPGQTFAPAFEISPQALPAIANEIREHEARIKTAYFADLWLMLSQREGQMTAREVAERHEEKMLQLGPVMERLSDELLDPVIDRVYGILDRRGALPEPPEELQGMELRIEYISIMAQAQKLLSTSGIERLASFVGNLAAVKPEVLDKLNMDELVDEYANALGVKPDLVRTDEEVASIRESRAQAQAQAQAAEQTAIAAQGAKTLSETDTTGDNALTRLLGGLSGAVAGQA